VDPLSWPTEGAPEPEAPPPADTLSLAEAGPLVDAGPLAYAPTPVDTVAPADTIPLADAPLVAPGPPPAPYVWEPATPPGGQQSPFAPPPSPWSPPAGTPTGLAGGQGWTAPPRRRGVWLALAAAVSAVLVIVLGWVVFDARTARTGPTPAALPQQGLSTGQLPQGYPSRQLGYGRQLDVGQPWGTRCVPVALILTGSPSPALVAQTKAVLREAETGGIPVRYAEARTMASEKGPYVIATINPVGGQAPPNSSGSPSRYDLQESYTHNKVTGQNILTEVRATLYTASVGNDTVVMRKVVRTVIAGAAGIEPAATSPGTGLARHLADSADAFSPRDLQAMRIMSGCGT